MKRRTTSFLNSFNSGLSVLFLVLILLLSSHLLKSQTLCYDNFEGNKYLHYSEKFGVLDTLVKNPAPDKTDSTQKCALYIRNASKKFDNIKMAVHGRLTEVEKYATYQGVPPQITMKVYTTAPVGTLVEILLGSKGRNTEYPAGTNSQYQAYTTVTNGWEVLKFKFSQVPQGSETSFSEIDQITLLFYPNSSNSDTYYFDEMTGPPLAAAGSGTPEKKAPVQENKDKKKSK